VVFFCPACWEEIREGRAHCPHCGADLAEADRQPFTIKLRRALRHRESQTAVRAAWILRELRERSAVPDLVNILETSRDLYLAEAAAVALGKIGDEQAVPALASATREGALRVRRAAAEALKRLEATPGSGRG
jgi:predicted amidophosphoribosyltransferase